jgi:hypothetical protein
MAGRALPRAPEDLQDLAVAKQLEVLSEPGETPGIDIEDSVETFLDRFHIEACQDLPVRPQFTTNSASYAFSRREGGRSEELKELLDDDFPRFLEGRPPGSVTERLSGYLGEMGEFLSQLPYELDSRSVPISELGYKTRVVSCSDPVRVHISESYRVQLLQKLRRLRPCAAPLRDDIRTLRFPRGPGEYFVFSADLKQATDYMNHDVIRAFSDALEIPFEMVTGGTIGDCTIRRGTLMGIPCSWPILSLVHMWACTELEIPAKSYYLKGDDLIGLWTLDEIQRYQTGIQFLTGMPINLDKSFVSKDRGVFCERSYRLAGHTLHQSTEIISLRFLVNRDSEEGYPYPLKVRRQLWSYVGHAPYRRLSTIGRHWAGVPPRLGGLCYLPVEYGGLEVLPTKFVTAAPQVIASLASAVHDSLVPRAVQEMLRISWTKAFPVGSAERLANERFSVVELGLTLSLGGVIDPYIREALDLDRELMSAWAHYICVPARRVGYHRYYQVVKRLLNRLRKKVLPQHSRLTHWTVQGVRGLLGSLQLGEVHDLRNVAQGWEIQNAARAALDTRFTGLAFTS